MKNIFDTKNIEDITENLRNQLSLKCSEKTKEVFSLFEIKRRLTIDEILVGIFRKYKREPNRIWVSNTVHNLIRKGVIKKVQIGEYELVKKIEGI